MTAQAHIYPVHPDDQEHIIPLMKRVICTNITQDLDLQTLYIDNVIENFNWWMAHPTMGCHLKAVQAERIIGVIFIRNYWNLCSLFVDPEYQRQGMGKALVRSAIAQCRENSDESVIYLNAAANAIPFYESLGFIPRTSNKPQPPGIKPMRFLL